MVGSAWWALSTATTWMYFQTSCRSGWVLSLSPSHPDRPGGHKASAVWVWVEFLHFSMHCLPSPPPTTHVANYWQDIYSIDWSALSYHEPCHCAHQIKLWCFDMFCTLMQITLGDVGHGLTSTARWGEAVEGESLNLLTYVSERNDQTQVKCLKTIAKKYGFLTQIQLELFHIAYNPWLEKARTWTWKFPFWALGT